MGMSYIEPSSPTHRVSIKAIRDGEEARHAAGRVNIGEVERWGSAIAGGLMMMHGLDRGSFRGLALAVMGGALVYRGATGHCPAYAALNIDTSGKHRADADEHVHDGILLKHTMTINRTPMEVYEFVRDPANHHRYMEHVQSVEASEDGTFHWAIEGPLGSTWRFRSRHINEVPGHIVAWKTLPGGDIESAGAIRLEPSWDGRGTEVTMEINFEPPAGTLGMALARLFGHDPDAQVVGNLGRLKDLLEAGEVPPIGRRLGGGGLSGQ
jgi:uncharacterized membrane protein